MIEIYTDGAYSSSRERGGWAFVVVEDNKKTHSSFGSANKTTNNRMEIMAALKAMLWIEEKQIKESTIISDSMYVIGTMTRDWKKNKNVDLWVQMIDVASKINVKWKHVKGHSGNYFNDYCDMLAVHGSHLEN